MANVIDTMKDSEIEELYRGMSDDDLQNMLCQEKCLNRRQLIRKEQRIRKKATAQQVLPVSCNKTDSSIIKPSKEAPKPKEETENSNSSKYSSMSLQKDFDELTRELRDTFDVDKRRDLRYKINQLQSRLDHPAVLTKERPQQSPIVKTEESHYLDRPSTSTTVNTLSPSSRSTNETLIKPREPINTNSLVSAGYIQESKSITKSTDQSPSITSQRKETTTSKVSTKEILTKFENTGKKPESQNSMLTKNLYNVKHDSSSLGDVQDVCPIIDPKSKSNDNSASNLTKYTTSTKITNDYRQISVKVSESDDVQLRTNLPNLVSNNANISWFFKDKPIKEYDDLYFLNLRIFDIEKEEIKLTFCDCSSKKHQGIYRLEILSGSVVTKVTFDVTVEPRTFTKTSIPNQNSQLKSNIVPAIPQKNAQKNPEICVKEHDISHGNSVSRVTSLRERFNNTSEKEPKVKASNAVPSVGKSVGALNQRNETVSGSTEEDLDDVINRLLGPSDEQELNRSHNAKTLTAPHRPERKISETGLKKLIPVMRSRASNARSSVQQTKEQILTFCKHNTNDYKNVNITNYSNSWCDGLAFCALIHHFYPDSFDYSKLLPSNRAQNFNLAFQTAKERAGIEPLLDPDDMIITENPDWKCVYTYVQSMYKKLKTHPRNVLKRPEESND